jgi:hypothetical protein
MPLLSLGAKLWSVIAPIVGMILDVVQFWNYVCDVIRSSLIYHSCNVLMILTEVDVMAEIKISKRSIILCTS